MFWLGKILFLPAFSSNMFSVRTSTTLNIWPGWLSTMCVTSLIFPMSHQCRISSVLYTATLLRVASSSRPSSPVVATSLTWENSAIFFLTSSFQQFIPLASLFPLVFLTYLSHCLMDVLQLSQPTMLKKTLQCLEGIHLSQSGSLLMLYVDKLLSTPFRVLARMVDTLACRRVEMLLAETLQVLPVYGVSCNWVTV